MKSGQAQIVDARPFVEFGKGRIPGSIALDPSTIIKGDRIKNGGDLSTVFSRLSKDKPIVVYSSDYSRSLWSGMLCSSWDTRPASIPGRTGRHMRPWTCRTEATPAGGDAVGSKYTKLGNT